MKGKSIIRPSLLRQAFNCRSVSSSCSRLPVNPNFLLSTPKTNSSIPRKPFPVYTHHGLALSRPFSDYPPDFYPSSLAQPEQLPVPPNFVPVNSEEELNTALSKAEGEPVSAVFYFTATWCAPCRFISPVMEELARRLPNVTTYKIDIDEALSVADMMQEALASKLKDLNVTAVPTMHFFKEGKKKDEVVGADATRIVQTMNKLYEIPISKKDDPLEEK